MLYEVCYGSTLILTNRKLDPKLPAQELQDVMRICSESVYPLLEAIDSDLDMWVSRKCQRFLFPDVIY